MTGRHQNQASPPARLAWRGRRAAPAAPGCGGLAEVEGDRAVLAAGLPEVIAYYGAYLERLQRLRQVGAISSEEAEEEERGLRRELGKARSRLKATREGLQPAGSVSGARP